MQKRPSLVVLSAISRLFMVALALLALTSNASAATAGRIYCQGTELMADGTRIYLNGANTPWNSWNEFGGSSYDAAWWNAEFVRLKAKGINSTRIWICCDGTTHPSIDTSGNVTGASAAFWTNIDSLMSLAQANQIYVMASMMSFDFANPYIWDYGTSAHSTKYLAWTSMLKSSVKVQTMIDNFIVPFVVRYKDNPYLYAIDLCNEPEWINQNAGGGSGWVVVTWAELQRYVAMSAAAIHNSGSTVLVTIGSAGAKWNSVVYENNYWSDSLLQAQFANSKAFLDFFQLHYYIWMQPYYPLRKSASELQLANRPLVMGELPGKPTAQNGDRLLPVGETIALISEYFFNNGFSGHYPWTSNGVGDAASTTGSLTDFGAAALAFQQAHPTVIRFPSTGTAQTITFPPIATQNWLGSNLTVTLGATASSSLTVAYTVTSGPATVSASTLTITGSGSVVVAANQAGNATYATASQVSRTATVSNGQTPTDSSASSSDSGGCGMGIMSAMFVLMMFGLFQRSLVAERLRSFYR